MYADGDDVGVTLVTDITVTGLLLWLWRISLVVVFPAWIQPFMNKWCVMVSTPSPHSVRLHMHVKVFVTGDVTL